MLEKLVPLLRLPLKDGFEVVYGVKFCELGTADLHFVSFKYQIIQ